MLVLVGVEVEDLLLLLAPALAGDDLRCLCCF